jgi:hypothetical protein
VWVAIAPDPRPAGDPAYPFAWYTAGEIEDGLPMFEDSRVLAPVLFECFPAWHAGTAQACTASEHVVGAVTCKLA